MRVANMAYSLSRDLVEARTCYKHLAGELGMSIISALIVCGYIIAHGEDDNTRYALSVHGKYWSQRLGIPSLNRTKISACMDYSHQGHHNIRIVGDRFMRFFVQSKIYKTRCSKPFNCCYSKR